MSPSRIDNVIASFAIIKPRLILCVLLAVFCLAVFPKRSAQTSGSSGAAPNATASFQQAAFTTFVVSNTGDNGGVDPAPLAGTGTLRQAIIDANANAGADAINFNIPGAAPHTISLLAPLPAITGQLTIDGTSQPDFAGSPVVELSGLSAGAADGLTINAASCVVRALVMNRFNGHGIVVTGNSNVIEGNFIGTNATGTFALANTQDGVFISGGSTNTIGGTTPAARNLLSGNRNGIQITGAGSGNQIRGNFIGTNVSGGSAVGNSANGVLISGSSGNAVGAVGSASTNTIAFNGAAGVAVTSGTGNSILSNSIFLNGGLGIDLGAAGVTPNDAGDGDSGANNLQNFPVLTSATQAGTSTAIEGTLNSTASTAFRIEFYSNQVSNPSGFGEGQSFIGSISVATDATGNVAFSPTLPVTVAPGQIITATATSDLAGNTSEFSKSIQVGGLVGGTPADLSVTVTMTPSPETGSDITKIISVTNAGPATATSVTVTDVLSASLAFLSCNSTAGGVCGGSGNIRTITFASLPPGTTAVITIVARVNCTVAGGTAIGNTASVFSASTPDNNPGNNMATATSIAVNPAPRITCPGNITRSNDSGSCGGTVSFSPVVLDNCGTPNVSCSPPSGATFAIGTTAVNCIATDAGGATATCLFTVTINDTEPLALICPSNITVTAPPGQCSPPVSYPAPTVLDNCPGAGVSCVPPSGSSFSLGVTNVLCTATDARGVQATCGFTVTVIGTPLAVVTLEGDGSSLRFGPVAAGRKLKKLKKQPARNFTIENIGCEQLVLTFLSLNRIGDDVDAGLIADPDDRRLFNLYRIDPIPGTGNPPELKETLMDILADVEIPPGQKQTFKLRFNPLIPAVARNSRGLSADEALPDVITSVLTFTQNGGAPIRINLVGRIDTAVKLIEPDNPRLLPLVTFLRSGNDFIIEYSVYDSNLDVDKATYQFFGKKRRPVLQPITVDLGTLVRQSDFVLGQSFTIVQTVTGARDHPEIIGVAVTVSDSESSATVNSTSNTATSSLQVLPARDTTEVKVFSPDVILPGGKRRAY